MPILRSILFPVLLAFLLVSYAASLPAQITPAKAYQIKGAFLYHFTQFVEWPAQALSSDGSPMIIGVLGEDPYGSFLDEIVKGEVINGHPLTVRRYKEVDEIRNCHILFINLNNKNEMEEALESLKGRNILTVSDAPGFIRAGGMIRFVTVNKKIQFQINPEAAKAAGLKISSKLLRLAEIVTPDK